MFRFFCREHGFSWTVFDMGTFQGVTFSHDPSSRARKPSRVAAPVWPRPGIVKKRSLGPRAEAHLVDAPWLPGFPTHFIKGIYLLGEGYEH